MRTQTSTTNRVSSTDRAHTPDRKIFLSSLLNVSHRGLEFHTRSRATCPVRHKSKYVRKCVTSGAWSTQRLVSDTAPQFAILLDGGFVLKKLEVRLGHFPHADEVEQVCTRLRAHPLVEGLSLLRIYFYNAPPAAGKLTNPLDRAPMDLSKSPTVARYSSLHALLELKPDFALRLGECVVHGWELKNRVQAELRRQPRALTPGDFKPRVEQKGVDLRIGLDIARLALCHRVRSIIVVTGDSDFVPAFRFARREGLRVYLDPMGHGVRRELKAHADQVIDSALPPALDVLPRASMEQLLGSVKTGESAGIV